MSLYDFLFNNKDSETWNEVFCSVTENKNNLVKLKQIQLYDYIKLFTEFERVNTITDVYHNIKNIDWWEMPDMAYCGVGYPATILERNPEQFCFSKDSLMVRVYSQDVNGGPISYEYFCSLKDSIPHLMQLSFISNCAGIEKYLSKTEIEKRINKQEEH
ncbi:MAG: hypothetical protein HQL46_16775, partial [Gammaproteobacteria bacterium]|nr:hypothetical protein [Gammaproteobacteria bacterium]